VSSRFQRGGVGETWKNRGSTGDKKMDCNFVCGQSAKCKRGVEPKKLTPLGRKATPAPRTAERNMSANLSGTEHKGWVLPEVVIFLEVAKLRPFGPARNSKRSQRGEKQREARRPSTYCHTKRGARPSTPM